MYNKPFKYVASLSVFDSLKVSTSELDSGYKNGDGLEVIGTPDILWENICFIEEEKLIWTHGEFYNQDEWVALTDAEIEDLMPEDSWAEVETTTEP